ncbi:ABC transporter substrate-binding protein [Yoonia sp.]|uniref:ABC transporter substrate-binding protein n=1 Tax=Yoonia sp. TaxID=2212373 RepID=UPI00391D54F8
MTTFAKTGLIGMMLAGTTALPAMAQDISWIYCGDRIDPVHENYIAEWEAMNEGWTVTPEVVGWAQCQDKATTLAAAGSPVGMAYVGSRTLKEFAINELIVPVPMSEDEMALYYPHIVDTVTFEGTQWGVPIAFSTKAMYWNKDIFEAAGLDPESPPTTWEETIDAARQITENTDFSGYGLSAKTFDNTMHQFLHWVYTNNGQIIDSDDNIVMDSPEVLQALEAYRDITPYSVPGATAYEQNEMRAIFLDGQVGMLQASIGTAFRAMETDMNWGVTNLPTGPAAEGPGTLLITDSLVVFSETGVEDKAIEFAKFITSPDVQLEYEMSPDAGLTPLRPSAAVDDLVAEAPHWAPYIDGIEFGGPEPLFTDYTGFQNVMIEMVQAVVTGDAEPADALTRAAGQLEDYK